MKGERIKNIREKLGLSQKEFGELIGVHFTTINRWENERFDAEEKYHKILQFLEELVKEAEKKNSSIKLEDIREIVKNIKEGKIQESLSSYIPARILSFAYLSPFVSFLFGITLLFSRDKKN